MKNLPKVSLLSSAFQNCNPNELFSRAGLNALVAAQAFGATKIAITDVRENNLPLAERLGAKYPLHTPRTMSNLDAAQLVKSSLPPDGPDCVIDCAGFPATMQVQDSRSAGGFASKDSC